MNCLVITGHYGSGKTELALHQAMIWHKDNHHNLCLCDVDVINPYFRAREQKQWLEEQGIHLVAPSEELMHADLPIISPEVLAKLKDLNSSVILDAGGDHDGATAIGQFSESIKARSHEFWFVANLNRPQVSTKEKIMEMIDRIERKARLRITGLIHNTHLAGGDFPVEELISHERVVREVAAEKNIPLVGTMVERKVYDKWDPEKKNNIKDLIIFSRKLTAPWHSV
ncbi:hypothetical protein [Salisediminibacterium beveridgei]|uniref:CobQ/CobB/MinD/ParA nucleotide binding domain-containing protein n=1 Tax=Salisediminibacterium beveridgei TaxID=632773 RepID=A0A1D7QUU4_9BACI|nr:hypothetical protein [Salisediminibacterium beveridgei]AOM82775.1 hypothetical protein BBEV_1412 [Salisediminibacterium beveridgei]